MKKIILLLITPFIFKAQTPAEKSDNEVKTPVEKTAAAENPREQTKQLLESYRQRILKGENFGALARLYSQDPGSAKNGGIYSNVAKGIMVPEFEEMANRLKPGEISEVFETQYGFHFIQLISRNGDLYNVRHILLLFPK
jgi:peptidyl-prolyl cis-trans isomerase SurA